MVTSTLTYKRSNVIAHIENTVLVGPNSMKKHIKKLITFIPTHALCLLMTSHATGWHKTGIDHTHTLNPRCWASLSVSARWNLPLPLQQPLGQVQDIQFLHYLRTEVVHGKRQHGRVGDPLHVLEVDLKPDRNQHQTSDHKGITRLSNPWIN
jgi:hypothetical protein